MRWQLPATSIRAGPPQAGQGRILESLPGSTALNLSQSLDFAKRLQQSSGSVAGEITYVGPGADFSP